MIWRHTTDEDLRIETSCAIECITAVICSINFLSNQWYYAAMNLYCIIIHSLLQHTSRLRGDAGVAEEAEKAGSNISMCDCLPFCCHYVCLTWFIIQYTAEHWMVQMIMPSSCAWGQCVTTVFACRGITILRITVPNPHPELGEISCATLKESLSYIATAMDWTSSQPLLTNLHSLGWKFCCQTNPLHLWQSGLLDVWVCGWVVEWVCAWVAWCGLYAVYVPFTVYQCCGISSTEWPELDGD